MCISKMKEFMTTITQRNQVTIPAEVRRVLGIKPKDKVVFTIEDGEVRLESLSFSLESAYEAVKPVEIPGDFVKISREVKDAKAEEERKFMRAVVNGISDLEAGREISLDDARTRLGLK